MSEMDCGWEWRCFYRTDTEGAFDLSKCKEYTVSGCPEERTDIYWRADDNFGIKERNCSTLEIKKCSQREQGGFEKLHKTSLQGSTVESVAREIQKLGGNPELILPVPVKLRIDKTRNWYRGGGGVMGARVEQTDLVCTHWVGEREVKSKWRSLCYEGLKSKTVGYVNKTLMPLLNSTIDMQSVMVCSYATFVISVLTSDEGELLPVPDVG